MTPIDSLALDPFAAPTARFVLTGSTLAVARDGLGPDEPSAVGVRPWGLRRARPAGQGRSVPTWTYDDARQLVVDATGRPLIDTTCGDPSADTTSTTDGEDGPSSEDWDND
ncbi:MAG: putative ATP-grasp-modified RiPP [Pseudonocardia sp.]